MPTVLPRPRRVDEKPSPARTVANFLFNAAMMVSALILAFIVLVREEQYAFGRPESPAPAIEQTAPPSATATTGSSKVIPPSN